MRRNIISPLHSVQIVPGVVQEIVRVAAMAVVLVDVGDVVVAVLINVLAIALGAARAVAPVNVGAIVRAVVQMFVAGALQIVKVVVVMLVQVTVFGTAYRVAGKDAQIHAH